MSAKLEKLHISFLLITSTGIVSNCIFLWDSTGRRRLDNDLKLDTWHLLSSGFVYFINYPLSPYESQRMSEYDNGALNFRDLPRRLEFKDKGKTSAECWTTMRNHLHVVKQHVSQIRALELGYALAGRLRFGKVLRLQKVKKSKW